MDELWDSGTIMRTVPPLNGTIFRERRRSRYQGFRFGGKLLVRRAGEREALILAIICTLDMMTTLWWVVMGQAIETNALLAWTFAHHPITFVIVKCVTTLPALILAPRLAEKRPRFTVWLLRAIIIVYVGWYALNVR